MVIRYHPNTSAKTLTLSIFISLALAGRVVWAIITLQHVQQCMCRSELVVLLSERCCQAKFRCILHNDNKASSSNAGYCINNANTLNFPMHAFYSS